MFDFRKKIALFLQVVTLRKAEPFWQTSNFTKLLTIYSLVLGILFTFFVPPFAKPDEAAHFFKTIAVSNGQLICNLNNEVLQLRTPSFLYEYADTHSKLRKNHTAGSKDAVASTFKATRIACTLPFLPYLPAGIILAPFVGLQLNPDFIFYTGRLINLFITVAVILWAYKVVPRQLRLLPASLILLPMTWHQASSFNKEQLHFAFGLLGISLLLSFFEKKSITYKEVAICLASLSLAIIIRPQYFPLILLAYLIPKAKIKNRISLWQILRKNHNSGARTSFARALLTLTVLLFIFTSIKMSLYTVPAEKMGFEPNYEVANADLQVEYLRSHPQAAVTVPYYTFIHQGQFLYQSMIGTIGSFDTYLDWYIYVAISFFLGYVVIASQSTVPKLTTGQLTVVIVTILGCVSGVLLAMYLYATPVGFWYVRGLQGRYFILLLPLVLLCASLLRKKYQRKFDISLLLLILFSIIKMTITYYQ